MVSEKKVSSVAARNHHSKLNISTDSTQFYAGIGKEEFVFISNA